MKYILVVSIFLTGCAHVSGVTNGPNGKPIYEIKARNGEMAFNAASEKCPSGYSIVGSPIVASGGTYAITIECK